MEEQNKSLPSDRPPHAAYPAGKRELLFCGLMLVCGLCLGNFLLYGGWNLGFAMAGSASILLSAGYLYAAGHRGNWYTRSILALCLIITAGFARSDDVVVKFVLMGFLAVGVNLALCITAGQNHHAPGGLRTLLDAPRALFSLGFGKMPLALRGVTQTFRHGGTLSRKFGGVLLGLLIAVPVLAVVIPLLMSADAAFEGLWNLLPDWEAEEFVTTALVGGVLFCVLFTRGVALHHEEKSSVPAAERHGLSPLTMNTALGAVDLVYLAYLLSQLAYFSGGFSGILPQGYSTAQYARRGFFEMACLSGINLLIVTFSISKVAKSPRAPLSTRLLCLFLGLVTEFLVFSSAAKMLLYIDTFGLTRLRVLTMVVQVFLGITTALVSLWLFLPKLRYMQAVILLALVLGAGVLWLDVDTQVARYNVSHYLAGELESADAYYLHTLGSGAVPYLAQLAEHGDSEAEEYLSYYFVPKIEDFRDWNFTDARALELLPEDETP